MSLPGRFQLVKILKRYRGNKKGTAILRSVRPSHIYHMGMKTSVDILLCLDRLFT